MTRARSLPDLRRHAWPWIGLLIAIGAAYRFVYVFDQVGQLDGDNAVVALMARHILAGRHYAFFWGQAYMGSIEPYSIAAVASVFGLNDVVLRSVPLLWGMLYVASFYPLTLLTLGRAEALVALALAALAPPLLAVWGPSPRGGYSTMLFLGHVTLILAVLLSREERPRQRDLLAFALGLAGGLAFWTHLLSVVGLGAAATALSLRNPRILLGRAPWLAAIGFLAGSAPLWIANVKSGFATFEMMNAAGHGRSLSRATRELLKNHGPKVLGVRDLVGDFSVLLPPLGHLVGAAIILSLVWGGVRAIAALVKGLRAGERAIGPEIFVWLLAFLLTLDLTSWYGTLNTERYLLPAYGAIFPLVASSIVPFTRGRPARAVLLAIAYVAVVVRGARALHLELSKAPQFPVYLPEVVRFMEEHGIRYAVADHGEALVNTYRSDEHVVLRDFGIGRYPIEEIPGWRIEAFLMRGDGETMRAALAAMQIPAKVERFPKHALVHGLDLANVIGEPLEKRGWRARASSGQASAANAIDDDLGTRWGSESPQAPDMIFEIDLGGEYEVSGVRLEGGAFKTDTPRGLRIEGRLEGNWQTLVELRTPQPGLHVADGELKKLHAPIVEARFEPRNLREIRLVQTGADRRYDWSIAEVDVFAVIRAEDTAPRSTNRRVSPAA